MKLIQTVTNVKNSNELSNNKVPCVEFYDRNDELIRTYECPAGTTWVCIDEQSDDFFDVYAGNATLTRFSDTDLTSQGSVERDFGEDWDDEYDDEYASYYRIVNVDDWDVRRTGWGQTLYGNYEDYNRQN